MISSPYSVGPIFSVKKEKKIQETLLEIKLV